MPYKNEHSCEIDTGDKFVTYRRKNGFIESDGKPIDVVFGILPNGKTRISSFRYRTEIWSESEAKKHCKKHKGKFVPAIKEKPSKKEATKNKGRSVKMDKEKIISEVICKNRSVYKNIIQRIVQNIKKRSKAQETILEYAKRRSKKYGIGIKQGGHLIPPSGYPTDEKLYGDPVNYKYLLETVEDIKASREKFLKEHEKYTKDEKAIIWSRIIEAEKRYGIEHLKNKYLDGLLSGSVEKTISQSQVQSQTEKGVNIEDDNIDDIEKKTSVKLNRVGYINARDLINKGKIDYDSKWDFSAEDGNKILGEDNDWDEYKKWFLGIDESANEETKGRYKYPFGKDGKVYRKGVIAIKQRSAQQGHQDIYDASSKLLEMIDKRQEKKSIDSIIEGERAVLKIPVQIKKKNEIIQKASGGKAQKETYYLEGVASNTLIDRQNERITEGFLEKMEREIVNLPVLYEHIPSIDKAIGVVEQASLINGELHIRARLVDKYDAKTQTGSKLVDEIIYKYEQGIPIGLSIGGKTIKARDVFDEVNNIEYRELLDGEIYEVSVTVLPAIKGAKNISIVKE